MLAPPLQRLVTELAKLPGIGQRTAQRLAFHILRAPAQDSSALAEAISDDELVDRFKREFEAVEEPPPTEET